MNLDPDSMSLTQKKLWIYRSLNSHYQTLLDAYNDFDELFDYLDDKQIEMLEEQFESIIHPIYLIDCILDANRDAMLAKEEQQGEAA
ncbi:MAG: hypothetical protein G8D89_20635 [gamma proteobacterium symbiont of Clathrolucina costata]